MKASATLPKLLVVTLTFIAACYGQAQNCNSPYSCSAGGTYGRYRCRAAYSCAGANELIATASSSGVFTWNLFCCFVCVDWD